MSLANFYKDHNLRLSMVLFQLFLFLHNCMTLQNKGIYLLLTLLKIILQMQQQAIITIVDKYYYHHTVIQVLKRNIKYIIFINFKDDNLITYMVYHQDLKQMHLLKQEVLLLLLKHLDQLMIQLF